MKLRLVSDHCQRAWQVDLVDSPVTLGRGEEARIRVRDRWVSRRHCEVNLVEGKLFLRDLGAKHGTYVNGQPIAEVQLSPGDEIRIGLTALRVEDLSATNEEPRGGLYTPLQAIPPNATGQEETL
jgi:pSer/pThr/pTyr-binding forkhead associated (FHA) protein